MTLAEKVLQHIHDNFSPDAITIQPFPLLPGGQVVKDRQGGELLFYWDILYQKIRHCLPDKVVDHGSD